MELAADQSESVASCSRESLLDLLMRQQTHGELGVRLGFHQDLLQPLPFHAYPYHCCALCGKRDVALYLYSQGMPAPSHITVATFAAAGVNGTTPWRKELSVSPKEVALLAGDNVTAMVMSNIERGVPLHWTQENHHQYPEEFKSQVASLMEALCRSGWFLCLPGTARTAISATLVQQLSRDTLWSMLDARFWGRSWRDKLSPQWFSACGVVLDSSGGDGAGAGGAGRASALLPQYQFRVATGQRAVPRHRLAQVLKFGLNMASWLWVLRRRQGRLKLVLSALGAASGASLPAMAMVVLTLLEHQGQ